MSATGKDTNSSTTSSFISALVVAGITVGAFTTIWLVLHGRKGFKRVFQPRTELAPESKRPTELPSGIFSYWKTVLSVPDQDLIAAQGPDAYFFVRFLKVFGVQMMLPYFLLTFIILIPVSASSPNAGLTGLNILTFGNVAADHQDRHVAHFFVALILMSWTVYLLWREYRHFVDVRQAWLSSAQHLTLARARTVVITGLPEAYNSESALMELAGKVGTSAPRMSTATQATAVPHGNAQAESAEELNGGAGGIRKIWMVRKVKPVEKVWEDRDKECVRLEGGVGKLIKLANKNEQKGKTPEKQGKYDAERASQAPYERYVLPKKVPTWKQGFLGLIGQKMTLESSPEYIDSKNKELDQLRSKMEDYPLANTAFLRFASQADAHNFARLAPLSDKKLRIAVDTGIEVIPEDVVWTNTGINPYQRKVRKIISWALTIGLIIIWAIPVAFVGLVSNVDTLCVTAPWLAWICTLPAPALGIIKGVLPPVLLAVLFMLLPIVLRLFIKLQGEIRQSDVESKLFTRFWLFQVIHGFLIVTLASGLINALGSLGSTASSVPTLLASRLPGASIFFLTFILTATFASAAKAYSRAVPAVMFMLRGVLGGNTPRKWYNTEWKMPGFGWATTWPPMCLIVCITMVYSVIQPVITLLALVAFCMLYGAYKHALYWCCDQPDFLETGGMLYIKALRTVFVSLYLEGICLAGLFFLSTNQDGGRTPSGLACGVIMAIFVGLIAAFQIYIDWVAFKRPSLIFASSKDNLYTAESKVAPTTLKDEQAAAGPELGNTSGFHAQAFDHPALWKKQPVIWIADDKLGIGKYEAERITSKGVEASTEHAAMDERGKLTVDRSPPDEAWYYGFTA